MDFPSQFIAASLAFSEPDNPVPAPYLRKSFTLSEVPAQAALLVGSPGFYELTVNGQRLTKGALAPYLSNPDDFVYFDRYELAGALRPGENVLGLCLGNGLQNNPGGWVWQFHQAPWRGSPRVALRLEWTEPDGNRMAIEGDDTFRTAPSPILYDDLRHGEYYDSRLEMPGWDAPGFDDSGWKPALPVPAPRGTPRLCEAEPITVANTWGPVRVTRLEDGHLYDFGINTAGVCRLRLAGRPGQTITMQLGEHLLDGRLSMRNLTFEGAGYPSDDKVQKNQFICRGGETQTWTPRFTFHGFRHVFVQGMDDQQATPEALTCEALHSALPERGGFECSDETLNKLQLFTRRSTLDNFYYFPTDCPHREKNGWTGDAALSAEHILLNLEAERSFAEWLHNVRKSQRGDGGLPGIVPTARWGYDTGPAWDSVITWLPYYTYLYRGDRAILADNARAILRHLDYLDAKTGADGLLNFGLGDWCPAGRMPSEYKAPLAVVNTLVGMDSCAKASFIFGELGMLAHRSFAESLRESLLAAARLRLLDHSTLEVAGRCQTSQALALHNGLFLPGERSRAFAVLMDIIRRDREFLDVGVIGGRVLFHVLADFGEIDLAVRMIARPEFPSYGWWVARGATTLWEDFKEDLTRPNSQNHHFWGDISHFFIRHLAGIHYNPRRNGRELDIRPRFAASLRYARGWHRAPQGMVRAGWERRSEDEVALAIEVPEGLDGYVAAPAGYVFADGTAFKPLAGGEFSLLRCL